MIPWLNVITSDTRASRGTRSGCKPYSRMAWSKAFVRTARHRAFTRANCFLSSGRFHAIAWSSSQTFS